MGKGSSRQAPVDQTVRQTNLPEYADPYFRRMLQGAEESLMPFYPDDPDTYGDLAGQTTYQAYPGERIAPSDMYGDIMSSRAMTRGIAESGIAGMPQAQADAQAGMDIQSEALGGLRGLANYDTGQFSMADTGSFADEFQAFDPTRYEGFEQAQANSMMDEFQMANFSPSGEFEQYDFRDPMEFSKFGVRDDFTYSGYDFDPTRQFGTDEAERYMSPYMQAVVEDQKSQAIKDFDRQGSRRAAQAIQSGAFGGSRQAVQEALAEEALQDRLGSIGATGSQAAFEQAQQQFERDRSAQERQLGMEVGEFGRVQAGLASEQGRVDALRLQEQSQREFRQADEYARSGNMEAAEAARVQAANTAELARTQAGIAGEMGRVQAGRVGELGRAQGLTASEMARVQGAEEASRQFGAGQGLAAYQAIGSGASNLASLGAGLAGLGERQRAADIQGAQLLETIGRDIRAEDQGRLDLAYEDFIRQRDYPISQYERMASILRGVPVTPNVEQTRFANYNPIQQALGAGISGLGLYKGLTA